MERPAAPLAHVALVGAGPGDPELVTVRAARLLAQADVVVHDALVGDGVLALAPATAELIDVGKRPGNGVAQDLINLLLVRQRKLMLRNRLFIGFRIAAAFFMSVVYGGLYWQGSITNGFNFFGLFLNCCMHLAFANISEMSGAVESESRRAACRTGMRGARARPGAVQGRFSREQSLRMSAFSA